LDDVISGSSLTSRIGSNVPAEPFPRKIAGKVSFFAIQMWRPKMVESVPMTREGFNKIKAEIEHLENEVMPEIAGKIAEAREEGDLKENAEYHAQRENQGKTQARINMLKDKLARASIVDMSDLPRDEVAFGCTVTVEDQDDGMEEQFTFVGAGEEDYKTGKILVTSPIGKGLLGKKVDEVVEIEVPAGTMRLKVVKIEYPDV
jgi:transcription elongation factor GreA